MVGKWDVFIFLVIDSVPFLEAKLCLYEESSSPFLWSEAIIATPRMTRRYNGSLAPKFGQDQLNLWFSRDDKRKCYKVHFLDVAEDFSVSSALES